jgi:SAM-dependent methyltransferase
MHRDQPDKGKGNLKSRLSMKMIDSAKDVVRHALIDDSNSFVSAQIRQAARFAYRLSPRSWNSYISQDGYPKIRTRPGKLSYSAKPTIFEIEKMDGSRLVQEILYSQATLIKVLDKYGNDFSSVLDIGSHAGNVANVLRFLSKHVTTCEISPGYEADYKREFMDINFGKQFDAIWCSQVLEHQRNVGAFLNKVFDSFSNDGILTLTVPHQVDNDLFF